MFNGTCFIGKILNISLDSESPTDAGILAREALKTYKLFCDRPGEGKDLLSVITVRTVVDHKSPTTMFFRTTLTRTITLYKLLILLGSNHYVSLYFVKLFMLPRRSIRHCLHHRTTARLKHSKKEHVNSPSTHESHC